MRRTLKQPGACAPVAHLVSDAGRASVRLACSTTINVSCPGGVARISFITPDIQAPADGVDRAVALSETECCRRHGVRAENPSCLGEIVENQVCTDGEGEATQTGSIIAFALPSTVMRRSCCCDPGPTSVAAEMTTISVVSANFSRRNQDVKRTLG